jgi:hypothetical protein
MGVLEPVRQSAQAISHEWLDRKTGRILDSRRLIDLIQGWATTYCLDDEGKIPLVDFRYLVTNFGGRALQIRHGVSTGPRALGFGFNFPQDKPPPGEEYKEPPVFPFR